MEILNPTIPNHSKILFRAKFLSIKFSITCPHGIGPNFKFHLSPSSPLKLLVSGTKNFRVSAHFGKPTSRRNSLRKKLIEQVRQTNYRPGSSFENPDGVNNSVFENFRNNDSLEVSKSESESESKSGLLSRLESWVDQYKADSEFWGIGSNPIFTVFHNSDGSVEKVNVNEDEILRRSQLEDDNMVEAKSKVSHAKFLAREMEKGNNVIPKTSSVAKFVSYGRKMEMVNGDFVLPKFSSVEKFVTSGWKSGIRVLPFEPALLLKASKVGISVLCGFLVFLAFKSFFTAREDGEERKEEFTSLEKEMLRRKIKARMEREKLGKGSVEVIQESKEPEIVFSGRPQLDKQELMDSIVKANVSSDIMRPQVSTDRNSSNFDHKVEEIRMMARRARELEKESALPGDNSVGEDNEMTNDFLSEKEMIQIDSTSLDDIQGDVSKSLSGLNKAEEIKVEDSSIIEMEMPDDTESITQVKEDGNCVSNLVHTETSSQLSETPDAPAKMLEKDSVRVKPRPRIIKSVKEAKEYLFQKHDKQEQEQGQEAEVKTVQPIESNAKINKKKTKEGKMSKQLSKNGKTSVLSNSNGRSTLKRNKSSEDTDREVKDTVPTKNGGSEDGQKGYGIITNQMPMKSNDQGSIHGMMEELQPVNQDNWLEKNYHEFKPVVEKIKVGFRKNYNVAREKVKEDASIVSEMAWPKPDEDDGELDWMKDDKLREIVFQVRENELMGRDPFYLMDPEDKLSFFEGLEKKVEKENEKLSGLHHYVHSNIENLDYGADGISLYDPPEKIIPRWKGPPPSETTSPEFLNDYLEQRKTLFAETFSNSNLVKRDAQDLLQKSEESHSHDHNEKLSRGAKSPKTVIEGSDGSVRASKKSGKEFWQHTKKWSHGFLESYNAETDPEVKAVMKDIGKDLDRWITEKEIQDAADLMDKLPEKGRKLIQEKLNKVKREMELYGTQAVVSKYSEYAEEKEEDYYWWLDLPFVMCIELYMDGDGGQRIGFYSLEMATDLEIEPKPYHIIAFEDAGDCKNLCYIIQAHMEMLGNGNAFVVAQSPKDAYREAKANGFNVTVIRKGELQLNVDQTLEEVEEQITEIGSKMYHDKIMKGRSVDISALMKGVFGVKKPIRRRRSKKKLKKPT